MVTPIDAHAPIFSPSLIRRAPVGGLGLKSRKNKPHFYFLLSARGSALRRECVKMALLQYIIAETRDCSPIQSKAIFSAYEEAWHALDRHLKRRDRIANPDKLGKLLLDAIIDQMDSHRSQKDLVDASLIRMGFMPTRRGDFLEIE